MSEANVEFLSYIPILTSSHAEFRRARCTTRKTQIIDKRAASRRIPIRIDLAEGMGVIILRLVGPFVLFKMKVVVELSELCCVLLILRSAPVSLPDGLCIRVGLGPIAPKVTLETTSAFALSHDSRWP
jgi:hypothetical protein